MLSVRLGGRHLAIIGDMNARVGTSSEIPNMSWQDEMSSVDMLPRRSNQDRGLNAFGRNLLLLCASCDLLIVNGRSTGDAEGKHTFHSHIGASAIDLTVVSSDLFSSVKQLEVLPRSSFSDHKPVMCGFWAGSMQYSNNCCICIYNSSHRSGKRKRKDPAFLEEESNNYLNAILSRESAAKLSSIIDDISGGEWGASKAITELNVLFRSCLVKAFGNSAMRHGNGTAVGAPWWTPACAEAKDKFKAAHKRDLEGQDGNGAYRLTPGTMELRRLYKKVKTGARLRFEVARARELSNLLFKNPRVFYREFNRNVSECGIKDVEVWTSWFKALVGERVASEPSAKALKLLKASLNLNIINKCPYWRSCPAVVGRRSAADELNNEITVDEVCAAISDAKRSAAPGTDGIPPQCIIEARPYERDEEGVRLRNALGPCVAALFNSVFASGSYPREWEVSTLSPIFKGKGSDSECSNYRGVFVANSLAKIYGRVIGARLSQFLEVNGLRAWSQAGGRQRMGVLHHHFVLQHLQNKYRAAKNKGGKAAPLYVCFVDFEKAFDKVNRDLIWMRLEERGLHGTFLGAIKAMYNTVIQKVKVGGKLGEEFETHSGVKQGDPLSTDLFGIMIEIFV